jgi:glycosyltransferase involved in cell wall biosynthesis
MIHYMTTNGLGTAWVGNELRVVMRENVPFRLHALFRAPIEYFESDDIMELAKGTNYLYPLNSLSFILSILVAPFRFRSRFLSALWNALTGPRENLMVRAKGCWHLLVACHWARQLSGQEVSLIHSQWIHSAGTVAMYGAWLLGVPFSFTGHAADLFRDRAALSDKIRRADFIVCISKFHERFFIEQGARPEQLRLAYCGIDPSHFSPKAPGPPNDPPRILSSGRLVEKKGFHYLIEACRILRERGVSFDCVIAGSGPLDDELRALRDKEGLSDVIEITGEALSQEAIPDFMKSGDVYCLACVWASDNDVDGLPQMLMEAMSCGLPVVSTDLVGIPDLVIHEETGLLATPRDAEGLADQLARLLQDSSLAAELAAKGRQRVLSHFDIATSLDGLVAEFRRYLGKR